LLPLLQVMNEVKSFLQMMDEVYTIFGLDYTMALSTRPEGYLGTCNLPAKCADSTISTWKLLLLQHFTAVMFIVKVCLLPICAVSAICTVLGWPTI
jgi:hypothetical protein